MEKKLKQVRILGVCVIAIGAIYGFIDLPNNARQAAVLCAIGTAMIFITNEK